MTCGSFSPQSHKKHMIATVTLFEQPVLNLNILQRSVMIFELRNTDVVVVQYSSITSKPFSEKIHLPKVQVKEKNGTMCSKGICSWVLTDTLDQHPIYI